MNQSLKKIARLRMNMRNVIIFGMNFTGGLSDDHYDLYESEL